MWLKEAEELREAEEVLDEEEFDDFIRPFDEAVRDSPEITDQTFIVDGFFIQ